MAIFYCIVALTLFSAPVWSYGTGSPKTGCSMLGPKHPDDKRIPIAPQKSAPPYTLSVAKNSIGASEPLAIQLTASGSEDIQGFLFQAQLNGKPVGTFDAQPSGGTAQTLECSAPADSITHTKIKESQVKSVTFQWTPSNDLKGKTVKLIGTIAAGYNKFWVKGVTADIQVV